MTQVKGSYMEPPPRDELLNAEVEVDGRKMPVRVHTARAWDQWFNLVSDRTPTISRFEQALSPASVAANTTAERTFTVTGLTTRDAVFVNKPTHQAGLGIVGARVSAADTLVIIFVNVTGLAIVPTAAETYFIVAVKM